MENNRMEQFEALKTLTEFNERLVNNLPTIIDELSGNRQPDTDTYLKNIIDAINWEISVVNATLDVINEGENRLQKEDFNQKILALSSAMTSNIDSEIAAALQNLSPLFHQLGSAVKAVIPE